MVHNCRECSKYVRPHHEPMIPTELPQYPWQKLGADLFQSEGEQYVVVVDYFSRYPEVAKLVSTTSADVIRALKSLFGQHGIPEAIVTDNGPQFDSREFEEFTTKFGIKHETSSPSTHRLMARLRGLYKP